MTLFSALALEVTVQLQSWTKLVETNAISKHISQFSCIKMPTGK